MRFLNLCQKDIIYSVIIKKNDLSTEKINEIEKSDNNKKKKEESESDSIIFTRKYKEVKCLLS